MTPGNAITVAGAALVGTGLYDIHKGNKLRGTLLIGAGRFCDVFDGSAADRSGTKSSKGEGLDAGIDGAEMVVGAPILVVADMLPMRTGVTYSVQKLANAAATKVTKGRGNEIHPSWAGKRTNVWQWSSIGLYGLAKVAEEYEYNQVANILETGAKGTEVVADVLGAMANIGYVKDALVPSALTVETATI